MDDEWQSLAETTRRWGEAMIEKRIAITKDETVSVICHESVREIVESKLEVLCACGDEIVAGDGARCGTCVAVKYKEKEWVGFTQEEHQAALFKEGSFGAGFLYAEKLLKEKNI